MSDSGARKILNVWDLNHDQCFEWYEIRGVLSNFYQHTKRDVSDESWNLLERAFKKRAGTVQCMSANALSKWVDGDS